MENLDLPLNWCPEGFASEWCSSCVEQEGQDERESSDAIEMLLEGTPEKYLSYAETCSGLWNYTLKIHCLGSFQSFQLNYKDFWKGLRLISWSLKTLSDCFPRLQLSWVSFEEWSHRRSWRTRTGREGLSRESCQALITVSTDMFLIALHSWPCKCTSKYVISFSSCH